jgi:superfamily II DNA or RNA helicase
MVSALDRVRDAIARAVLGDHGTANDDVTIGAITLRAHQRDALRRVRASVESAGGALLADEPGLGKTFVALALAHEYGGALVVAPAALRAMWRDAAAAARIEISFVSLETLSRADVRADTNVQLVIVDEAHHVSNPAAARYARLARLVAYRHVLLLSATPVRNRRAELAALLALFMGPRAHILDDVAQSNCIVRRAGDATLLPEIDGPHWHRIRSISRLHEPIAQLPPALPALDGRAAAPLITMTLARCWASSLAALDAALRRRMQRGAGLAAILDEGRMPTRDELRAWIVGDDSVQLAFPVFVTHECPAAAQFRATLETHLAAVRAIRDRIGSRIHADSAMRAQLLLRWRAAHPGARIVAFTSHASTAEALFRALRRESGVALLTARGARTAGGVRPRADVITALGASARRSVRDDISLVIATDLLSEGVNLQGASVIVHLDVPWTPAGMDQRVGRSARMGSAFARVHVYGVAAPAGAERLLTLDRRLHRKRAAHIAATSSPAAADLLRAAVGAWRMPALSAVSNSVRVVHPDVQHPDHSPHDVATVRASRSGFIAAIANGDRAMLACGAYRGNNNWKLSDSPIQLLAMARSVQEFSAEPDSSFESGARAALHRWLAYRRGRELTGVIGPSRARRALLSRIDVQSARARAHARASYAKRIARVRALIDGAVSAGAEHILDEISRQYSNDLESLLSVCETRLASAGLQTTRAQEPPTIRALLLLRVP